MNQYESVQTEYILVCQQLQQCQGAKLNQIKSLIQKSIKCSGENLSGKIDEADKKVDEFIEQISGIELGNEESKVPDLEVIN